MTVSSPTPALRRGPAIATAPVQGSDRPEPLARRLLPVAAAVVAGVAIRAVHVLPRDFPLNDGGLFFAMVRDLQQAHYRLPAFTSYNAARIPFAYSPLGFYLAGWLQDLTGMRLADAFRWIPLAASCLTVPACALLARELIRSRTALVAGVVAFGLLPRSFLWLIMGGGLTRAPGFLFAILALHQLALLYRRRRARYVVTLALFAALTALSHLGTTPFLAFSAGLFFLALGRHRFGARWSAVAALGAAVATAPWWGQVIAVHGPGPFLAANATGGSLFADLTWEHFLRTLASAGLGTGEPLLALGGMLAVLGALSCVASGGWFLPVWWIAIIVLDARAGSTYATLPIAMLAGLGVSEVVLPVLRRARLQIDGVVYPRRRAAGPVLGILFAFGAASALLRMPGLPGGLPDLVPLSTEERWAMRWLARTTAASARILAITDKPWEIDKTSEWLPVIAERVGVATVQGTEWLPHRAFQRRRGEFVTAQGCGNWLASCLDDWSRATGQSFTHVFIPKANPWQCCRMLLYDLRRDPDYRLVYDGPGATIFARRPPLASAD